MDTREILEQLQNGDISIDEAERSLKRQPYEDLGFAHLDMHRKVRTGYAEVVFCQSKPDDYLLCKHVRRSLYIRLRARFLGQEPVSISMNC